MAIFDNDAPALHSLEFDLDIWEELIASDRRNTPIIGQAIIGQTIIAGTTIEPASCNENTVATAQLGLAQLGLAQLGAMLGADASEEITDILATLAVTLDDFTLSATGTVETAAASASAFHISQAPFEIIQGGASDDLRISQEPFEIIQGGASDDLRISQAVFELIHQVVADAVDVSQLVFEIIIPPYLPIDVERWIAPVTITPKTGAVMRLAAFPVRHPSIYWEPRIKSYGIYSRAIGAPVEFIRTGDGNLTVVDSDNLIRARLAVKTMYGASVEIRLGPEGGSYMLFYRPLDRLIGTIEQSADGELTIPLKDSIADYLGQNIPGLVDLSNFPDLPEESAGAFAPIVYGRVSANEYDTLTAGGFWFLLPSSYSTQGGAIKPVLVKAASSNYRYLIARHPCLSVELWKKKFDAKTFIVVPTGDYTIIEETIPSGHTVTIAKFTTDQRDYEIRANVKGLYDSTRYSFVGFHGRHEDGSADNDYYTQIGLVIKDNQTGLLIKTPLSGANVPSNEYFEDGDIPSGKTLYSIKIWEGEELHIYNTQMGYKDAYGIVTYGTKWGIDTERGHENEFIFAAGEYLTKISGVHGDHIDSLTLTTNITSAEYGDVGGTTPYEIIVEQSTGTNFADAILALISDSLGFASDKIDRQSFISTATKSQTLVCAGAITEQITWAEAITRLQRSSNIDVFTNKNDLLTARFVEATDPVVMDLTDVTSLYRGTVRQGLAAPIANRIPFRYSPNFAADTWTEDTHNNDDDQAAMDGVITEEALQMYFVRDPITARAVVAKRADALNLEAFRIEAQIPLVPSVALELGDLVAVTHFGGMATGGYEGKIFKIIELGLDIDNLRYNVKAIKMVGALDEGESPGPGAEDFPEAAAYWRLDELGTETVRLDASGNGHDGTPVIVGTGALSGWPGKKINCLGIQSDGEAAQTYLEITSPVFDLSGNFTLAFWWAAYWAGAKEAITAIPFNFVGTDSPSNAEAGIQFETNAGGQIVTVTAWTKDREIIYTPATPLVDNEFFHFVLYYEDDGLYLDMNGANVASDLGANGNTGLAVLQGIGDTTPATWNNLLTQLIDEAGIYELALSAYEKEEIYNWGGGWSPYPY